MLLIKAFYKIEWKETLISWLAVVAAEFIIGYIIGFMIGELAVRLLLV